MLQRRCYALILVTSLGFGPRLQATEQLGPVDPAEVTSMTTDLLIVGATESGWAAALQAARSGVQSITIVHDGQWFGGQFTEQALACVDENKGVGNVGWGVDWHPMKRSFHRSGLFKELMDRIEAFNEQKYGLRMPGRPYHGPSTFRPVEAEAVFRGMLQPWIDAGTVRVFWNRYPVRADVDQSSTRPKLTGLWFQPLEPRSDQSGNGPDRHRPDLHVEARLTIDASDWGEAIQVSGAAFECGPDPKSRYQEPSAPENLDENPPNEMNPITWAMIIEQAERDVPIARPPFHDDRNFVRSTQLSLAAMPDLPWDRPVRLGSIPHWPDAGKAAPRQLSVYTVRRVIEGSTSREGRTVILLNYMLGQDYPLERLPQRVVDALEATEPGASSKNIVMMTRAQREIVYGDARHQALSLLYHMQNFVHERAADTTHSLRHFQLSSEFGTRDRLPPKPYIRESLRLKAMYMMREQDGRNADGPTKAMARERFARVMYPDGLFAWQFHYDFHRTGRAYLQDEGASGPWIDFEKPGRHTHHVSDRSVFPLRSLVPVRMDGLLGAQKNVGYSSIVCAAIRLHDQCIAIGQAAGATAAVSLRSRVQPHQIPYARPLLESVRNELCPEETDRVPLLIWPFRDLAAAHPAFAAINRLAARGALPLVSREVDFRPDEPAEDEWRQEVVRLSLESKQTDVPPEVPGGAMSRGEFCRRWWLLIRDLPERPFPRKQPDDADGDGIADADDPSLFTPDEPIVWKLRVPGPDEDGLPSVLESDHNVRAFNFSGRDDPAVPGFVTDWGRSFDESRGYGWKRNITPNHRRRQVYSESLRDTLLFSRDADRWECAVPNGLWQVTICVGDSGHEQTGHRVTIEGRELIRDEPTPAGAFLERQIEVEVHDGRLTVDLGLQRPGTNTTVNWIRIKPR